MPAQKKTAKVKNNKIEFLVGILGLVVILLLAAINIGELSNEPQVIIKTEKEDNERLAFWRDFVQKNPSYYDGYLELARQEALEGNEDETRKVLGRADEIFPNAEKVE